MDPMENIPELFGVPSLLIWQPTSTGDWRSSVTFTSSYYQKQPDVEGQKAGVSTAASTLEAQWVRLLAKQMAHGIQTAECWYQLKDMASNSVEAFRMIQSIRSRRGKLQQTVEEEPSSGGTRMKWMPVKEQAVRDSFSASIEAGHLISTNLCKGKVCSKIITLLWKTCHQEKYRIKLKYSISRSVTANLCKSRNMELLNECTSDKQQWAVSNILSSHSQSSKLDHSDQT